MVTSPDLAAHAAALEEFKSLFQADKPSFQPSLVPSYMRYIPPNPHHRPPLHLFHTGGALKTFESHAAALGALLGEKPATREQKSPDGRDIMGKKAEFKNGIGLVFLMEKSAIGIQVPEAEMDGLRERLRQVPAPSQQIG